MKNHAFSRYYQRLSFSRNHHLRRNQHSKSQTFDAQFYLRLNKNIDWTIGPNHWTLGLLNYSGLFFFFLSSFGPFYRLSVRGSRQLVLREGWDAVYRYSGRGGRQTVIRERWGGSCFSKYCLLMKFSLDHTVERFFRLNFFISKFVRSYGRRVVHPNIFGLMGYYYFV